MIAVVDLMGLATLDDPFCVVLCYQVHAVQEIMKGLLQKVKEKRSVNLLRLYSATSQQY